MQSKHLSVLIHIRTKGEVGAPLNQFSPPVKYFNEHSKGVLLLWIIYVISVLFSCSFVQSVCRCLVVTCWERAALLARLSFVMSNCDVVTFSLVCWVRCGA